MVVQLVVLIPLLIAIVLGALGFISILEPLSIIVSFIIATGLFLYLRTIDFTSSDSKNNMIALGISAVIGIFIYWMFLGLVALGLAFLIIAWLVGGTAGLIAISMFIRELIDK